MPETMTNCNFKTYFLKIRVALSALKNNECYVSTYEVPCNS